MLQVLLPALSEIHIEYLMSGTETLERYWHEPGNGNGFATVDLLVEPRFRSDRTESARVARHGKPRGIQIPSWRTVRLGSVPADALWLTSTALSYCG